MKDRKFAPPTVHCIGKEAQLMFAPQLELGSVLVNNAVSAVVGIFGLAILLIRSN